MTQTVTTSYRKDLKFEPGHGYGRELGVGQRPVFVAERALPLSSIIVHSTSNAQKGTRFEQEVEFIRDSPYISAHACIGKEGQEAIILPEEYQAWHSGTAQILFSNPRSWGAELHVSQGEEPTQAQIDTLSHRVKDLIARYHIPKDHVDTHRAVALPRGRKSDPEGWSNDDFYRWRDGLYLPSVPLGTYFITADVANVRAEANTRSMVLAKLTRNTPVAVVEAVKGEAVGGDDMWLRIGIAKYVHRSLVRLA